MSNQTQRVLNHLIDHGYITQAIGNSYGIRRVGARIHELKPHIPGGVQVELRVDDAGVRYAYYSMHEQTRAFERHFRDVLRLNYRLRDLQAA